MARRTCHKWHAAERRRGGVKKKRRRKTEAYLAVIGLILLISAMLPYGIRTATKLIVRNITGETDTGQDAAEEALETEAPGGRDETGLSEAAALPEEETGRGTEKMEEETEPEETEPETEPEDTEPETGREETAPDGAAGTADDGSYMETSGEYGQTQDGVWQQDQGTAATPGIAGQTPKQQRRTTLPEPLGTRAGSTGTSEDWEKRMEAYRGTVKPEHTEVYPGSIQEFIGGREEQFDAAVADYIFSEYGDSLEITRIDLIEAVRDDYEELSYQIELFAKEKGVEYSELFIAAYNRTYDFYGIYTYDVETYDEGNSVK